MNNQREQPDNSQIQPKICKSNHKQIQCEIYRKSKINKHNSKCTENQKINKHKIKCTESRKISHYNTNVQKKSEINKYNTKCAKTKKSKK